jgi:molecular chaperone HtpG
MSTTKKKFKTEVQELLNLVIHSLYSNTDIFLRELLSNASDAIDRLRFESLTDTKLVEEDPKWKIKITYDKEAKTITISDNGIGMTRLEVEENIGTIAHSGTRTFLEELKKSDASQRLEMIGQFGVGFYSSFMVAHEVALITRKAGATEAVKWSSKGDGSYTLDDAEKAGHGTEVTLHLQDEKATEYLEDWKIRQIIKKYSDFVEYPIVMDVQKEPEKAKDDEKDADKKKPEFEEQTINSMKAIWMRSKEEIKDEEYNDFYMHISHDYANPMKVIHYSAEGSIEFKALLYIPSKSTFELYSREEQRKGIHLYVKRVYIMDDCKEILPEYLRFIKGVVESSDLPLNISREILQENALVKKIRKNLVGKILNTLSEMKEKSPEEYVKFYTEFGRLLKEGVYFDYANKEKLQDLVMFESTKSDGKLNFLRDYVTRMDPNQKEIYYLAGENRATVENSPQLEIFKAKDIEVLLLTDPIDDWSMQGLSEYNGKKLKAIDRGDLKLDFKEDTKPSEEAQKESEAKYKDLLEFIKGQLSEDVKEVRLSTRLTDSASCLVADEHGMSAHMERMFKAMNQQAPPNKRVLELNANHPVMGIMEKIFSKDKTDAKLGKYADLLFNMALLAEGSPVRNLQEFNRSISELMLIEGNIAAQAATNQK